MLKGRGGSWLLFFALSFFIALVVTPPALGFSFQVALERSIFSLVLGGLCGIIFLLMVRSSKLKSAVVTWVVAVIVSGLLAIRFIDTSVQAGSVFSLASVFFIASQVVLTHCMLWAAYLLRRKNLPVQFN